MKKRVEYDTYNTDSFMRKLYGSLVRDFRPLMGSEYKEKNLMALRQSVPEFRSIPAPDRLQAPPWIFKMEAQLEGLFKRYRFKVDMYTDEQLAEKTFETFMENQLRLATVDQTPLRSSTFVVVQRARRIIKDILKNFDPCDAESVHRFSTRATVGNPARDAYIDHKLADPITGSPEHIKWFKSHLRRNGYLSGVIAKCSPTGLPSFVVCDSLPLVSVPKSYKSERLISPNTLIGSYYTYGLGSVLVAALKEEGLDISKLQIHHQRLAKKSSRTKKLVTADLSAASESFLWSLICRLLPRKWVVALNKGRLRYYIKDGKKYHYCSFMAMGIGFTFPLQTLLFYAIVKAICSLLKVDDTVSVYGDDLIYPRRVHKFVSGTLENLGMKLNVDKTFVESNFRESCGGDYYHGVDVRPFSPEGVHQKMRRKQYEAWLYQIANGLFARWDECSLPITARFIRLEILRVALLVKQVPPSFPDFSGWRVEAPDNSPFSGFSPVLRRFRHGSHEFVIAHLTQTSRKRYVSFEEAFLYDWLRSKDVLEADGVPPVFEAVSFDSWLKYERFRKRIGVQAWFEPGRDSLCYLRHPRQPKRYRDSNGKRLIKQLAASPCKLESQKISTSLTDSISDWI